MTACTATIQVGGETLACNDHDASTGAHRWLSPSENQTLIWNDDALGAVAHRDPEPTYRAEKRDVDDHWVVRGPEGSWRAIFQGERHPDPEGAAEAEAARLRGETPLTVNAEVHERAMLRLAQYRKALEDIACESGAIKDRTCCKARRVLDGGDA